MKVVVVVCAIVMTIAVLFIARQVTLGMDDAIEQKKAEKAIEKALENVVDICERAEILKAIEEVPIKQKAKVAKLLVKEAEDRRIRRQQEAERKAVEVKRIKEQQEAERKAAEERKAQLSQILTNIGIKDPQIEKSCLNIKATEDKVSGATIFNLEYSVVFDELKSMEEVMAVYAALDARKDRIIKWRSAKIIDGGFLYIIYVKPKEVE